MIYLDHNATTPMDPGVASAMEPYLTRLWGNPSSVHSAGRQARRAVEEAREEVAALLGASSPEEIVFTSGGTESDALALGSILPAGAGAALAISAVEHPAVAETARKLGKEGFPVRVAGVRPSGELHLDAIRDALKPGAVLLSVMAANNEYGGIFPIAELAEIARESGAVFHSDAVAALGRIPIDVERMNVDLLSVSAHKISGPKGVGALYVRRGIDLEPIIPGSQERRRRGGTENVAGIVGFGAAARLLRGEGAERAARLGRLRDRFEAGVRERFEKVRFWGSETPRLPNTSAVAFPGFSGEALLMALDLEGVAASVGSACSSGTLAPSPSILALGATREEAKATLRFSFGKDNRDEEIPRVLEVLSAAMGRVGAKSVP